MATIHAAEFSGKACLMIKIQSITFRFEKGGVVRAKPKVKQKQPVRVIH